ncbi:cupin domain-containing protein [Gordonia sp. zg691]|uniref:Cupin domain-containing protein n=1 Tax=Gordonia jinghuaiqii TaxID=2758710 RepID=A0A7D7QWM1_9ACTN|nr:cupin domain-containing protein [Gordonia jinghuaiqii]MBD0863654.1 cupin domain-containing protein [Gordonia jinghuaiqii]MCR5979388.1 DUF861 domain-containing protein [Gordonia jinghuaiqii]QMT01169.1 cupin domain-containing protein [Gordonia jinghuaiqii]
MSQLLGNVFTTKLDPEGYVSLDDGTPVSTGAHFIGDFAGGKVGVWGAEVGFIGGEAADEIFVILEGRAEVSFDETGETFIAGPGDIVRLYAGKRNTWKTIEPIRKVSFWIEREG